MTKDFGDMIVSWEDDEETQRRIFHRVVDFFHQHRCYSGTSLMQSDNPQLEAPELLAGIADEILRFQTKEAE